MSGHCSFIQCPRSDCDLQTAQQGEIGNWQSGMEGVPVAQVLAKVYPFRDCVPYGNLDSLTPFSLPDADLIVLCLNNHKASVSQPA